MDADSNPNDLELNKGGEFGTLRLEDLKAGDKIVVDGGFTCIPENKVVTIGVDSAGHLFFPCSEGQHDLDGQLDAGEFLVGIRRAEPSDEN